MSIEATFFDVDHDKVIKYTPTVETIEDRIRLILEKRGWSARELARRSELAESSVGNILRNLKKNPDAIEVSTLRKIASGAAVPLEWLQTGSNTPDFDETPREADQEVTPSPGDTGDINVNRLGELPYFEEYVRLAKIRRPDRQPWVYSAADGAHPLVTGPISFSHFMDLLDVIERNVVPTKTQKSKPKTKVDKSPQGGGSSP